MAKRNEIYKWYSASLSAAVRNEIPRRYILVNKVEVHKQRDLCRIEREDGEYGGYRKDILKENLSERDEVLLICEICKGIMREASMSGSGEQVCSSCEVQTFPLERSSSEQAPNVALRKMISSLKCCCPLNNRGCDWLGILNNCGDHLDMCGYVYCQCDLECGVVLERKKIEEHESKDCPFRQVRCVHCDKELMSRMLPIHLQMCPRMEVSCELCDIVMCRKYTTKHLEDCVEKEIECPFAKYKCEVGLIKRKYLSQHLEEKITEHLELKLNAMEDLVMKQNELNSTSPK